MRKEILSELYNIITPNKIKKFDSIAANRTKHMTVALENIYQDHNASAVMRSCDCFGVQDLHVIESKNEFQINRDIALGAGKWVDIHPYDTEDQNPTTFCLESLKKQGYKIIATTPHHSDVTVFDMDISEPFALVFGTELNGLSPAAMSEADGFVHMPMVGFTESFNISVSAALCMGILRDRLEKSDIDFKLTEAEQTELKIKWCKRILRNPAVLEQEIIKKLESR